jgi:glutaredoxin-like protein
MLPNHEGRRVPDVTFRIRESNEWKTVTTHDLFDGKTVAVFSLPGAFTPTCSSTHLPRFNELAPAFFANGVDSILCISVNDPGFGKRSWRYSMLVKDGVVEKMFVEPQEPGDPFKVSDADTLLAHINPTAKKPDQVAILTREGCGFCAKAKDLLTKLGYDYAEVPLPHKVRTRVVGAITGDGTVPQVFINGERIGGLEALERWARKAA